MPTTLNQVILVTITNANIEAGEDYSGSSTTQFKQLQRSSADPDKTHLSHMSDLRVATDKFFMGNENFLP